MSQKIEKNKIVSVDYRLHIDAVDGQMVEDTKERGEPLKFLFGVGQLIPKFEENITGLTTGDDFKFKVESDFAYGNVREEAVMELSKEIFMKDGALIPEVVEGAMLPMADQQGNRMEGKIISISEKNIKMDFNHPMAGRDLFFSGKVVDVRDATQEELEHGHAH